MTWADKYFKDLRKDCCADRPKPCAYHEGFEDGCYARLINAQLRTLGEIK